MFVPAAAAAIWGAGLLGGASARKVEEPVRYYSTAAPARDYAGPHPDEPVQAAVEDRPAAEAAEKAEPAPRRIAASPKADADRADLVRETRSTIAPDAARENISLALAKLAESRARFSKVNDYSCTFIKRERINGKLLAPHSMAMKARVAPSSIYFKFLSPNAGREAIYVQGRNGGKLVAHDVGIGRLVAGTLHLDPNGSRAMEDNRHPITEAGLAHMLESLDKHWKVELKPGESQVTITDHILVGSRPCTQIETLHHERIKGLQFSKVRVFIDHELGLPIRFEAYDWPKRSGAQGELMEEYDYVNLRINVGLKEIDFDPRNSAYSYGRF